MHGWDAWLGPPGGGCSISGEPIYSPQAAEPEVDVSCRCRDDAQSHL